VFNHLDQDMFGTVTGQSRAPGPIANPGSRHTWHVVPRSTAWNKKQH